jgi:hypothetical protein
VNRWQHKYYQQIYIYNRPGIIMYFFIQQHLTFSLTTGRKGPKRVGVQFFKYVIMNLWQLVHLLDNIKKSNYNAWYGKYKTSSFNMCAAGTSTVLTTPPSLCFSTCHSTTVNTSTDVACGHQNAGPHVATRHAGRCSRVSWITHQLNGALWNPLSSVIKTE